MQRVKPRYQDLSKPQAFGVEARTVLRLFPLLVLKPGASDLDVRQYYSNLFDLCHLLIDVAVGNKTMVDVQSDAQRLHEYLNDVQLFKGESEIVHQALLLITDALAQLQSVRYIVKPGLDSRDQLHPELGMLMSHSAHALSKMGLEEVVFLEPAYIDCELALSTDQHHLSIDFFSRKLWCGESSPGTTGMVYAFEKIILEDWKQALRALNLSGTVVSYESLLNGMKVRIKPSPEPEVDEKRAKKLLMRWQLYGWLSLLLSVVLLLHFIFAFISLECFNYVAMFVAWAEKQSELRKEVIKMALTAVFAVAQYFLVNVFYSRVLNKKNIEKKHDEFLKALTGDQPVSK